MSRERRETLGLVVDAFNRRDVEGLAALLANDAEIVPTRAALEATTAYRGPTAAAQWYAAVDESWDELVVEIDELRERGDRVLGFGRIRGRGRQSGAAIDVEAAAVARFRDGLITNLRIYTSRTEALEAAGLSE